jgi:hypothetical protein
MADISDSITNMAKYPGVLHFSSCCRLWSGISQLRRVPRHTCYCIFRHGDLFQQRKGSQPRTRCSNALPAVYSLRGRYFTVDCFPKNGGFVHIWCRHVEPVLARQLEGAISKSLGHFYILGSCGLRTFYDAARRKNGVLYTQGVCCIAISG